MSFNRKCQAENCPFPWTHITKGHQCSDCGAYGHGVIEHYEPEKQARLDEYFKQKMLPELCCSISDCTSPETHSVEGHTEASFVLPADLTNRKCVVSEENTPFPFDNAKPILLNKDGKIYTCMYCGMGTMMFVKRSGKDDPLYGYIVDSDSDWSINLKKSLRIFLKGFTPVREGDRFQMKKT